MTLNIYTVTIAVEPYTGSGGKGPIYGAAVSALAYVESGFKKIVNSKGLEVIASCFAMLPITASVKPQDKVTIGGQVYYAIDVQRFDCRPPNDHLEVYLGPKGM